MNQSDTSWTRCAKEFADAVPRPSIIVKIPLKHTKCVESLKQVHVKKKPDSRNGVSCRGIVATDIALANLDQIETSESIAKWIAEASCTPTEREREHSPAVDKYVEESSLAKSPRIKVLPNRKKRYLSAAKSPILKKSRTEVKKRKVHFGLSDIRLLNQSTGSIEYDKSLTPENKSIELRKKFVPRILKKKLKECPEFGNNSVGYSNEKKNEKEISSGTENEGKKPQESIAVPETNDETIFVSIDNAALSQDLFDDEIITATPHLPKIHPPENASSTVEEAGLPCQPYPLRRNDESKSTIKLEKNIYEEKSGHLSFNVIEDTEDLFPRANSWEKYLPPSQRLFVPETEEVTPEKEKYFTETERIEYESNSEDEKRKPTDSDSDKTVSDLIEETTTQDCVEPLKSQPILSWKLDLIYSQQKSISGLSAKISETISLHEPDSPQISIVDISTETTPPRTQGSPVPAAELLDSAKKKKSRPKKGSLSARLQKLISGQASAVRLWRHQMSQESGFEVSSSPNTTLLVTEVLTQYGKNLYRSKIVNDPYDLMKGYFLDENARSLVVMTNPEFVGSVRLRAGAVFKIYLPWDVFNGSSERGNLVLHSLYFNVVSNPVEVKQEPSDDKSAVKDIHSKIVREFDCPCLRSGRLEDSCVTKFTDHKVDVIAEMIRI